MNDDPTLLASLYLDGDVTAEERARVDADPVVLAEVERLRQVRAVLSNTEPAPLSVRERHLAAALDVWDRTPERSGAVRDATPVGADAAAAAGAASFTTVAPSVRERRATRNSPRLLAIAAGLVLVLGGGLVVRTLVDDDGRRNESIADAPSADTAEELDARAALEEAAAAETFGDADPLADEVAAEPVDESASLGDGVSGGPESAPLDDDLEVLESDEDLAIFAADLIDAPLSAEASTAGSADDPAGGDQSAPAPAAEADASGDAVEQDPAFDLCGLVDRVVGPAIWHAGGLFEDLVLVGIDDATGEAVAYREDDCSVVARTPLLTP